MKVEMLREGQWIGLVSGWRIQSYGGGEFTVRGAYGGFVAPPWRVIDSAGLVLATDPDTIHVGESVYVIEESDDAEGNARLAFLASLRDRELVG